MIVPASLCVWALKALQNSMMLTPCWPSAGPTGGAGLAAPAGICSLIIVRTFLATAREDTVPSAAGPAAAAPQDRPRSRSSDCAEVAGDHAVRAPRAGLAAGRLRIEIQAAVQHQDVGP